MTTTTDLAQRYYATFNAKDWARMAARRPALVADCRLAGQVTCGSERLPVHDRGRRGDP